jgi:hypothetical protein
VTLANDTDVFIPNRRPLKSVTIGTIIYYDPTFTDEEVTRIEAEWAKQAATPA